MSACDRIRADAPGLASLAPGDPERVAAEAHAAGCAACRQALREAERLHVLIALAAPERLPAGALEGAARAVRAQLRRERRRRAAASAAAVSASVLALVALARSRSAAPGDWVLSAVLWALAAGLAVAATRRPVAAAVLSALSALAGAAASGGPGPVAAALGLHCLATELAAAAAVVAAGWLAVGRGAPSPRRAALAAWAAAGALGGDAALQLTCAARAGLPHLLAFHVGGVLLATGAAVLLARPRAATPA